MGVHHWKKSDGVRVHQKKERWGESSPKERAMGLEFTIRGIDGVRVYHEKKRDEVRGDHEKKSDRVRVHHEKERWGEFTITKSDGIRVHNEKKSDGVRVHHEKE